MIHRTTFLLLLTLNSLALAVTLTVPGQYSTLKLAIEAAATGDTIVLADGTYSNSGFSDLSVDGIELSIWSAQTATINCVGSVSSPSRFVTVKNGGSLSVSGLTIINGYHSSGGAILVTNGAVEVENCTISNCQSDSAGGAIYVSGSSSELEVENCDFSGNESVYSGGAIAVDGEIAVSLRQTSFSGNIAGLDGGAVAIENNTSGLAISGCTFTSNHATDYGGALAIQSCSSYEVASCLIAGNRAESYGGGLYIAHSDYSQTDISDNKISNCTITENLSSVSGGGLRIFKSQLFIANSIIYSNTIDNTTYYKEFDIGGDSSAVEMAHCICRGLAEFFDDETDPVYNFIEIGSILTNLGGNIDTTPGFATAGSWTSYTWTQGSYIPVASSYCYNNGLNDYVSENQNTDITGLERIQATYVDIGCYEHARISGGDLTGTMTISLKFPNEIIPGDKGKTMLILNNSGDGDLDGSCPIRLYISSDKYIDEADTLLAASKRDLRVKMLYAKPRSSKYTLAFTVPGTIPAGDYYLLAELDGTNALTEADNSINSNIVVSDMLTINWKFGNFGNRTNATLTLTDAQNVENRYVLKFGQGQIAANRSDINIISESEACMLTVTPRTKGAITELGNISCTGSFSLNAKKCDLTGDITVSGIMPKFIIGNVLYGTSPIVVTVSGSSESTSSAMLLMAGNVSDLNLFSDNYPIKVIKVNNWLNNDGAHPQIVSTWLGSITCKENFEADIILSGENAVSDIALKSATIKGNINNSLWQIDGHVKKISAPALDGLTLLVGVNEGITQPTGSEENDIKDQYSLTLALTGAGECMTDTTIIAWEISKLTYKKGSTASNSNIEYFYSKKAVTAPVGANIITPVPASGQELEIPLIPVIFHGDIYNPIDIF